MEDFFPDGVFFEPACEGSTNVPEGGCTQDMKSFRGFVLRWMADTAQLCPWAREHIMTVIRSSAEAAVETCTGGENGRMCGMRWGLRQFDGDVNLGQEMGVLSALMTMLLFADGSDRGPGQDYDGVSSFSEPVDVDGLATSEEPAGRHGIQPPLTHDTGGTSVGDPHAGQSRRKNILEMKPIHAIDAAMATVLTTVIMMGGIIMFVWMGIDNISLHKKVIPQDNRQLGDIELQMRHRGAGQQSSSIEKPARISRVGGHTRQ